MYTLNSIQIRRPSGISEGNSTMSVQIKTLDGQVNRDYFGSNKRVWSLSYNNITTTDYNVIKTIYDNFVDTEVPVPWVLNDANYNYSATVHIDIEDREFVVRGLTYLTNFNLILTEA